MEECGIEKAVCFAPFPDYMESFNITEAPNRWLYEEIENDDSLLGFGVVDFSVDNLEEQVKEAYELGLCGLKIHPAHQRIRVDGEKASRVYAVAEKYNMPISFHTGVHAYRISEYNTLLYDEVAYRFPKLKICMEHVGGYSFFNDAIAVMSNSLMHGKKTVYGGLTTVFDKDDHTFWYLGKEKFSDLIRLTETDMCIFGLDFPWNDIQRTKRAIKILNDWIDELGLGEEAREKIFGKNLLNMVSKN